MLGFGPRNKKSGTTHEDWVPLDPKAPFHKVTVDCPKAPFSQDLISSMAKQAGLNKKAFYALLGYGKQRKKRKAEDPSTASVPAAAEEED